MNIEHLSVLYINVNEYNSLQPFISILQKLKQNSQQKDKTINIYNIMCFFHFVDIKLKQPGPVRRVCPVQKKVHVLTRKKLFYVL